MITAEAQRSVWIEQKKNMTAIIQSLQQKNMVTPEKMLAKEREIDALQKELKSLQARVQQNHVALTQNDRYFCSKIESEDDIYEVDELLDRVRYMVKNGL